MIPCLDRSWRSGSAASTSKCSGTRAFESHPSPPPLPARDADDLLHEIRGLPLLKGHRGRAPADMDALRDVLLRVSRLAEEVPEISELDLNPVIALAPGQGCRIVDARIRVTDVGFPR